MIAVALGAIIIGGGFGIYYLTSRITTTAALSTFNEAAAGISWLDCDPRKGNPQYQFTPGAFFEYEYECFNTDDANEHKLEIREYGTDAWGYNDPTQGCLDQDDVTGGFPPDHPESQMTPIIANASQGTETSQCPIPAPYSAYQDVTAPDRTQGPFTLAPAGAEGDSVKFTTRHEFPNCNYHQWDDMAFDLDSPGSFIYLGYGVVRISGATCPNTPQAATGDLLIRIFKDFNPKDNQYTPAPSGEGNVFNAQEYTVKYKSGPKAGQEIDYSALCDSGDNKVGGAGQDNCKGMEVGDYTVENVGPLDTSIYDGPITTPADYSGTDPIDVTVVANDQVIVDFGYHDRIVQAGKGDLLVRIFKDINLNNEYDPAPSGEGNVFQFQKYTIKYKGGPKNGQEIDYATLCPVNAPFPENNRVGGAGQDQCTGLDAGDYTVENTDDPVATAQYDGPISTSEVSGTDPIDATVVANQNVIVDFGYKDKIVAGNNCQFTATPNRGQKTLTVNFDASASTMVGGITKYEWEFEHTAPTFNVDETQRTPFTTHDYVNAGSFTAALRITNPDLQEVTCTRPITVLEGPIVAQAVCAIATTPSPARGQLPLPVKFTVTLTNFPAGSHTFTFDPGDGSAPQTGSATGSPFDINYTYPTTASFGIKTAKVTFNVGGQTVECSSQVTLQAPPIQALLTCALSANPTRVQVNKPVTFTATVNPANTPVTYAWNFGDGATQNTGTVNTTKHSYSAIKVNPPYTATVTITDANDPTRTATCDVQITVIAGPITAQLDCDITKTVTDTDETNVEANTASPGELMTYNISWTCRNVPTTEPGASQVTVRITDDYLENMMTVVPGSISDAGIDGPPPGVIVWTKVGAAQVRSGSESFQVRLTSPLAPGTYTIPNVAIISAPLPQGEIDRDTTITTVVVPPGPQVPDIEILKFVEDVNGGTLLPGDTLRYTVYVWNAGNTPLTATVTENIQANVNSFTVTSIPQGAQDSSLPTGGTNGTGFLDIRNISLPTQGSLGTIVYTVVVNSGVPAGTQLLNIVTATAGNVSDSDDEAVVVGQIVPKLNPPTQPTGTSQLPPPLPTYSAIPAAPTGEEVSETGVSAQFWILLASLVAAFAIASAVIFRSRFTTR